MAGASSSPAARAARTIRLATLPKKSAPEGAVSAAATAYVASERADVPSASARFASGFPRKSATRMSQQAPVITLQNECGSAESSLAGAESGSVFGSA